MLKAVTINITVDSAFIYHLSNPWELRMKSLEAEPFVQSP